MAIGKYFKDLTATTDINSLLGAGEKADGSPPGYKFSYSKTPNISTPSNAVVLTEAATVGLANTAQANAEAYADAKFITGTFESNIALIDQTLGNDTTDLGDTGKNKIIALELAKKKNLNPDAALKAYENLETTGTIGNLAKPYATYNAMAADVTTGSNPNKYVAKYSAGLHAETTIALKPYVNIIGESIDASIITTTNPITLDSAFALADDDNSVILQNVFIGSQMNLNLKTVGGTSGSTIAFLTTVMADEINYTARTINDSLLMIQSFFSKMTITDGTIDIQACTTIGSSMTFIADTAGLDVHINTGVLPNITIMGGSATVSNSVSIKNSRLDGAITIHGTYAQLSIDADSIPAGGISYADGATSAQVTYLTKSYNVAGSPLQLANLTALQNYVNVGQMVVGMLGTAIDTGIVYKLTTKSTPGSHTWTPLVSGTGNITGTLTANFLPVATGANAISDSILQQDLTQDSGLKSVLKQTTPTVPSKFQQWGVSSLWNLSQYYTTLPSWEIWVNSVKVGAFKDPFSNSQLLATDASGNIITVAYEWKSDTSESGDYGAIYPTIEPVDIQNGSNIFIGNTVNAQGYNFICVAGNSNGDFDDTNLSYSKWDNGRMRFNNVIAGDDHEICRLDPLGNDTYFQDNTGNETYRFDRLLGDLTVSGDFFSANYTQDISDAATGSNSPSASNVFATMTDLSGVTVPAPKLETSDVNSSYYYSGLQITADNQTALSVSQAPLSQASTFLFLNGQLAPPGSTTDNTHWYTLSGSTVTWNNSNVDGVTLKTTDTIVIMYNYINGFDGYKTDTVPVTWTAPTAGTPTSSLVLTKVGNDITMDIKALTSGYIIGNATNGVITATNIVPALYRPTTTVWDSINVWNSNSGAGQLSSWGLVQIATDGTVTIGWDSTGADFQTITSGSFGFHSKAISWTK
jgi:hypothetical protein